MLVSRRDGSLVLVDQVDHGRLAGDIAVRWGNAGFAEATRRDQVELGTALHDEGWRQADAEPLVNGVEKRPLHFLELPVEDHMPLYARGVDAVYALDPYAGLLVSMHWTGIYRNRWGMQEGGTGIRATRDDRLDALRDEHVAAEEARWAQTKRSLLVGAVRSEFEARLWYHYDLLQVWDQLSLYLCTADLTTPDRSDTRVLTTTLTGIDPTPGDRIIQFVPRAVCGDRVDLRLAVARPGVVTVDPYPFREPSVTFRVAARVVPDRPYASSDEAAAALATAGTRTIECEMTSARRQVSRDGAVRTFGP